MIYKQRVILHIAICLIICTLLMSQGILMVKAAQQSEKIAKRQTDRTSVVMGDINGDSLVNLSDVHMLLRAVLKITRLDNQQMAAADVNEDGQVDLEDGFLVLKIALQIFSLDDNEQNHVYSDDELCHLALRYYEKQNNYRPSRAMIDSRENEEVVIWLYDDMEDYTATCDWYRVNVVTLKGTDLWGNEIDLNEVRQY